MLSISSPKDLSKISPRKAIKKPLTVRFWKMDSDFELIVEGISIKGYCGDYIVMTQHGHIFICDEDIFKTEYELVD